MRTEMKWRNRALLAVVAVAALALTGCVPAPGGSSQPRVSACSAAETFFVDQMPAFADDGSLAADGSRFSESAVAALRQNVPDARQDDLEAVLAAETETSTNVDEQSSRLQEWAIRECGIKVAFANEDTDAAAATVPLSEITVGGTAGVTIVYAGAAEKALARCDEAVTRGAVGAVSVIDNYGLLLAAREGAGKCVSALTGGSTQK